MLKTKNLLLIALTLVLVFMTIGFISAAETSGSFDVDTGGGNIIIDPDGCDEDWSGSTWGQCINKQQIFICFDKNSCGTEDLKPALCGEIRECGEEETPTTTTTNSNPGGGSPGDSNIFLLDNDETQNAVCTENWVCEKWSNLDQSCGTRTCQDANNCGTELLKPQTSKLCSDLGFSWITGGVIGGLTGFAKSNPLPTIFIVLIIGAGIFLLIDMYKNKTK